MKLKNSENKIIEIIQKDKLNYQGIFEIIQVEDIKLNDEFIQLMHENLIDFFLKQIQKVNENAKINHLNELMIQFKNAMKLLIDEYSSIFDTTKLDILKKNTLGTLKEIKESLEKETPIKTNKQIKINCDNVVILALFQELSKEIFIGNKFEYRISQLVSDNFISKNEKPIKLLKCFQEFTEGGGITDTAKQKLKVILLKIIDQLD